MKSLVLFDGNGHVSKQLKNMGHEVISLDILPLSHIDLPMDIMDFNPKLLNVTFDYIWASPPCETFSMIHAVKGGGNRYYETIKINNKVIDIMPREDFKNVRNLKSSDDLKLKQKQHSDFLRKTIDIIKYYMELNPNLIWFVENPEKGLMKFQITKLIDNVIQNKVAYCMYGCSYKKPTNIFSNVELELNWCSDPNHHNDNFHGRWDYRKQNDGVVIQRSYLDKSLIPKNLVIDIFTQSREINLVN